MGTWKRTYWRGGSAWDVKGDLKMDGYVWACVKLSFLPSLDYIASLAHVGFFASLFAPMDSVVGSLLCVGAFAIS
jgi:hypothetical protein